ncbi:hypothetical protein [Syntrophomonas wolfei]|jgi:hypothetical protein|uniref:hypothetical protein n=1 Tax=Syntrophomonas wolfei TaxID=863 RepID=UPI000B081079|nr:hypothetical protein [Syntrophomonas wolfei]
MQTIKNAASITEERRTDPMRKRMDNTLVKAGNVLAKRDGDQMTGWLIVVLVVVVVGAIFMTLYQGSITDIWNSIVDKITGLLN